MSLQKPTSPAPHAPAGESTKSLEAQKTKEEIEKSVIKDFLAAMEYRTPNISTTNDAIETAIRNEMYARKIQCPKLEKSIHLASSIVELTYHELSLPEKINAALMTWYLLYIDDISIENKDPATAFIYRYLRGQPQLDPVFDAFADLLLSLFDIYDTPIANNIITSLLVFLTANTVESQIREGLTIPSGAVRFPWFLRDRSGASVAYALFPYSKTLGLDSKDYIGALADMNFWICASNDLLSFHKENLNGEKATYIENRAFVEGKTPHEVLVEIERELRHSRDTIYAALKNPVAARAWRIVEVGYVLSVSRL